MAASTRVCRTCNSDFVVTDEELQWWRAFSQRTGLSWHMPNHCTKCRFARRRERLAPVLRDQPDEWLTCIDCGDGFIFGGRDRDYYAQRGFQPPKRCRPCRELRKAQSTPGQASI